MFLKSLEIHGFKSFPDRTKLEFSDGITAVVGPNGSGKSNISDAVRWVLGEQSSKTLRGSKMEDVIFSGTQSRKPQGFAEVSLTIDNSTGLLSYDGDTVTITRKYYRSGESEYLLNGAQVRLRDINELLMDTGLGRDGYALVEQGKVAEIVSAKSTERREIFEEAAGISKFRYRKEESERRLKMAEENLLRLLDIVQELETRIGPLKNQSEKAKKYLVYAEQKKELEISYWIHTLRELTSRLRTQDDNLTIANSESEELEKKILEADDELQEIFRSMQGCMTLAEQLRGEKRELEQENADVSAKIAVIKNDIAHNLDDQERIRGEIRNFEQSDETISGEIRDKEKLIEDHRSDIGKLDSEIRDSEERLASASERTSTFNTQTEAIRQRLTEYALEKTELALTVDLGSRRIREIEEAVDADRRTAESLRGELASLEAELGENRENLDFCDDRLTSLTNTISGYQMKQESRHEKLEKVSAELTELEMKIREKEQRIRLLNDLEQNMEGYSGSTKAVLRASDGGRLRGVRGSVAQLISVERQYSVAVETALGGALQNIVVEREENAKSAVELLKEQKAGRATFLPMTSVHGKILDEPRLPEEDGFVSIASELVECEEQYQDIIRWLLGRTAVADDLDSAIAIAKKYRYRFRIVTLDGQIVNAGGSITGGFTSRSQGILSRKNDIARLEKEVREMNEKRTELASSRDAVSAESAELDAQVEAIRSEMQTLSEDKIRLESEMRRLTDLKAGYESRISSVEDRIASSGNQKKDAAASMETASKRLSEIEELNQKAAEELNELEGSNSELLKEFDRISAEISELRIRKVGLEKDIESQRSFIESLRGRMADSVAAAERLNEQIAQIDASNEDLRSQISELEKEIGERGHAIDEIDHRVAETLGKREEYEARSTKVRESQRAYSDRRESSIRNAAHLEEQKIATQKEYDGIINQMWNEYEMTRSQAESLAKPVEDYSALQRELHTIRGKIRSLGSVNLAAIDEYEEVSQRYELMTEQIRDIENSRDELNRLIGELTENMKEMFADSFQKINRNFSRIFSDLFGGGKGELILTDPDDLLGTGIEINVQPPGKVIRNLASLSGGEQAFVAIAVYFAILNVRPAPFCILDEIEAALDDVNVSKYAHYLRSYSQNTQFILITHRRGTMEEADVLYGVTMQQEGVSKLLKLNIGEVESSVGKLN